MMHYEGVPVSSYHVIAEFVSVRIMFGATVGITEQMSICLLCIRSDGQGEVSWLHCSEKA